MLIALLCGVLFVIGLTQLFLLRFEAGDVYPPYSSLRADPLGTRALFESLNRISADAARRNFRSLSQIDLDPHTTLMIIGLGEDNFFRSRKKRENLLEILAQSGGRLVMTFTPDSSHWIKKDDDKTDREAPQEEDRWTDEEPMEAVVEEDKGDDGSSTCGEADFWDGMNPLGFRFNMTGDESMDDFAVRLVNGPHTDILPLTIPWRSPLSFELGDEGWETLYTWQDEPVVALRPWGRGTLVIAADSYLLSNEALRNQRFAGWLAWLVKPGHDIIFDEFHKGLVKQPGVAGLTRQYRLHGVFAALLAIALLFVWRHSAIFVPSVQAEQAADHSPPAGGRDTSQGMVHLARQHIGTKELLPLCFQAWKTQAVRRVSSSRIAEVQALVQQAAAEPRKETQVQIYKEICELLKQGKRP